MLTGEFAIRGPAIGGATRKCGAEARLRRIAECLISSSYSRQRCGFPGEGPVHPPIIDDDTFEQAKQLLAAKNARQVIKRPRSSPRPYVLRGLLFCGICDRRMQGTWNNGQTYYRCMFPAQYALANRVDHPRTVYLREAELLPQLDEWLTGTLDPARLPATLDDLAAAQLDQPSPGAAALREEIAGYARQLAQYRAALDQGGDPAVLGPWITATQARKLAPGHACADTRERQAQGLGA